MPALDLEAEYNNRKRVPEHSQIQERWAKASEAYLKEAKAELDLSYGSGQRHRYDLFRPKAGGNDVPLVVYIHGGYWQRGDRKGNGFLARELNARGVAVAMPSYTLCPAASIMDIIGELRRCLKTLWERTKQRPVVVGHSAGGHLAAAMLATDWSKVGGVPADLVKAGYAISGVFELSPLIPTSLNEALKLDPAKAREASPLLWAAPAKERTFVAAAGGDESQEFIRQALEVTAAWSKAGVKAECVVVPGANHFTVVEELANPESAMVARIVAMAKA
ncbi:MAG: alpha/beta hydrolase [Hyphomicrobiaceae bacterium]|nr:alpha/beta hydrolase [Hyphomicrobiaceae bacterium]